MNRAAGQALKLVADLYAGSCARTIMCRLAPHPGHWQDSPRRQSARMTNPTEIEAQLLDFLRREVFAPDVPVTPELDLIAAGFDSMSLVRLLVFIETDHGYWIPESEITTAALQNVRTLAETLARLLNAR
ncbi:MAG TPA: acyl carrier protein [Verrucomicrobiota bacterium]|nr:acyl carrier protein [Verrucomicrobiota bacterium]HNT15523.1 acyl carrier protein [Verrucomicrobiota bacterium]